jgi:hypothetical protein
MQESFNNWQLTKFTVYDFCLCLNACLHFQKLWERLKVIRHSAKMHLNDKFCSVRRTYLNWTPYLLCLFNSPSDDLNFFAKKRHNEIH